MGLPPPRAGDPTISFNKRVSDRCARPPLRCPNVSHDAVVARRRLRELSAAAGRADAGLVAGRLTELQHARIERARAELPRVWTQLRRRGDRAWRH